MLQAEAMEKKKEKKEKGKAAFGWDIFNQDSLYKGELCLCHPAATRAAVTNWSYPAPSPAAAHKKRLANVKVDLEAYSEAKVPRMNKTEMSNRTLGANFFLL